MAQMFIPELGTVVTLREDWTFNVVNERRNKDLAFKVLGLKPLPACYYPFGVSKRIPDHFSGPSTKVYPDGRVEHSTYFHEHYRDTPTKPKPYTWPAGTELTIDRIYIRKGNEDFSSVTFVTTYKGKRVRFFAKLADVNRMEII